MYVGFSFGVKRPYYGMMHNRAPPKRWQVHWRAILQHSSGLATEKELKYSYVAHNGNAAKWHFLPYITCGQVIPILKLKVLEDRIIKTFPNSLNHMAYSGALYTSVQDGTRALHDIVHDKRGDNRVAGRDIDNSVQITVRACGADGSTQQWHDLNDAVSAWQTVAWHSSYPWSTTQASRRWGQSTVLLYDHSGNSFVGSLERALRAGAG